MYKQILDYGGGREHASPLLTSSFYLRAVVLFDWYGSIFILSWPLFSFAAIDFRWSMVLYPDVFLLAGFCFYWLMFFLIGCCSVRVVCF